MADKQISKRSTDTNRRPERISPATPTGASHADPQALQAAVENPAGASPAHLLALQRAYGNRAVGAAVQRAAEIQRTAAIGAAGGAVDAQTQSAIQSARGGGVPLDAGVGMQVGSALGADFSGVKVHTDPKADALNRSLSAKAFTTGSDIFFSQGAYSPGSSSGKRLLAHELTHVVQQGAASGKPNKIQTKLMVGPAGDKYEQEADQIAEKVMRMSTQTAPAQPPQEEGRPAVRRKALTAASGPTSPDAQLRRA